MKKRPKNSIKRSEPKIIKNKKVRCGITILARSLKLAEHTYSGKIMRCRHTSYGILILLLMLVVSLLSFTINMLDVSAETAGSNVTVRALVPNLSPTVGAIITSPADGLRVSNISTIKVSGTCPEGLFIVVKNNGITAGSTICTQNGTFSVRIQLYSGRNTISALDYDNLNQAGPSTPSVNVYLEGGGNSQSGTGGVTGPTLPENPSIIPNIGGGASCDDFGIGGLPGGAFSNVAVVCIPRFAEVNSQQTLGLLVWGGVSPYALYIDWGDSSKSALISVSEEGYYKVKFKYANPGIYNINIRVVDESGSEFIIQTAIQINGKLRLSDAIMDNVTKAPWFEKLIPVYFLAIAFVVGFWCGGVFNRKFRPNRKDRQISRSRR
jgi:hypothetical protein